jgi:hypothetical protein
LDVDLALWPSLSPWLSFESRDGFAGGLNRHRAERPRKPLPEGCVQGTPFVASALVPLPRSDRQFARSIRRGLFNCAFVELKFVEFLVNLRGDCWSNGEVSEGIWDIDFRLGERPGQLSCIGAQK